MLCGLPLEFLLEIRMNGEHRIVCRNQRTKRVDAVQKDGDIFQAAEQFVAAAKASG